MINDTLHIAELIDGFGAKNLIVLCQCVQYDSVYLTCSKKLTCSQLSPPHGTNSTTRDKLQHTEQTEKLEKPTKNKLMTDQ